MQANYKALVRLLRIEPDEIPFKFKKGKPLFDGGLHELEDNLKRLHEKIVESLSSMRDSMMRQLIVNHSVNFLQKQEEALRDYFKKK